MKKNWKKVSNTLMGSLIATLGFEACDKIIDTPDEYGAPYAEYQVRGTVTDEEGTPIEGIKARMGQFFVDNAGKEQAFFDTDSAYTDEKGELTIEGKSFYDETRTAIILTDEDGEQNGGELQSDTIAMRDMKKEQIEEGKGWYQGKFRLSFTRQLKKK